MEHEQFGKIAELLGEIERIVEEEVGATARLQCMKHIKELEVEIAALKKAVAQGDFEMASAVLEKSLATRNRQALLAEIDVLLKKYFGPPITPNDLMFLG